MWKAGLVLTLVTIELAWSMGHKAYLSVESNIHTIMQLIDNRGMLKL
jgi:hypothetical protein